MSQAHPDHDQPTPEVLLIEGAIAVIAEVGIDVSNAFCKRVIEDALRLTAPATSIVELRGRIRQGDPSPG